MRWYRALIAMFAAVLLVAAPFVADIVSAPGAGAAAIAAPGAIHFGDSVSGAITTSGTSDQYTFTVNVSGTLAYLQVFGGSCSCTWSLTGPKGTVFSQNIDNIGPASLVAGAYVLTVTEVGIYTGTYSFALTAVPAPQTFAISPGNIVSNGVPSAGAGNIESPGAMDQYTFTVGGTGERVYLQDLSNGCGCSWTLRSSTGSVEHGFPSQSLGNVGPTWLPNDSYVLTVSGYHADTGTYSFQLSAVPDPETFAISMGDTVSSDVPSAGAGNIETPGAMDQYTFTVGGTGGERVYLQELYNNCGCTWSLRSASGSLADGFANQGVNNVGPTWLPSDSYVLTVVGSGADTGAYSFQLSAVPDPETFAIAVGDTVSSDVPSAGAGNIESPGAMDRYTFTVGGSGAAVLVQSLGGSCGCTWSLRSASGSIEDGFPAQGLGNVGPMWLANDSYVLTVVGSGAATGSYSFQTLSVPDPQTFAISLGATITNGTPATGAGNIESPGAADEYTFTASASDRVIITGTDCDASFTFVLSAPSGRQLVQRPQVCGPDTIVDLPDSGQYQLEVSGGPTNVGTYTLHIVTTASAPTVTPPAADVVPISVGDTVAAGIPTSGAGNIETAGAVDDYPFSGTAGQAVLVRDVGGTGYPLSWQLFAPDGTTIGSFTFGYQAAQRITLTQTGTYEIEVGGSPTTGTYSFSLTSVPASQLFAISVGDSVSDGVPTGGAGNIEVSGGRDEYAFNGTAGERIRFNDPDTAPASSFYWTVYAPDGTPLAQNWLSNTPGQRFRLPTTGQYTITVDDCGYYACGYYYWYSSGATGPYAFSLSSEPDAQVFPISVGDSVSDGVPTGGAGHIEVPGADDEYTFTGTAGQTIRFNDTGSVGCCSLYWSVYAPDGTALGQDWFRGSRVQRFTLQATGQYTIRVNDYYNAYDGYFATATGPYAFSLTQEPPADVIPISVGDSVSNGVPAPGAGNIESPGSTDQYVFNGTAGQTLRFDDPGTLPCCSLYWQVLGPDGSQLAANWFGIISSGQQFTLPANGQYTIIVDGDTVYGSGYAGDATGTYDFTLELVPLLVPTSTAPIATYISAGQNAVWTIGIQNTSGSPLTGVTAALHANGGGTPLAFDGSAMPSCHAGPGNVENCALSDIPAHSTKLFTVFAITDGLTAATAVTGDVTVSATGVADASGTLDTVTIASCGVECVLAVAAPGVSVSSTPGLPTAALPTKQILLLPADTAGSPAQPAIPVTLKSITPSALTSAADRALCPTTGTPCTGQISVFAGTFTKYANRARPIQVQVLAHWNTVVPSGKLLMNKDTGGPPIQLATCVQNSITHLWNTPCSKTEVVTGSAANHNLTTHDTILFVGGDPHFARRAVLPFPNPPTAVKATAGIKLATVTWTKPVVTNGTLTGYVVRAYVGTTQKQVVTFSSLVTKETIRNLVTGANYTFKVQARNAHGLSYLSIASIPIRAK